MTDTIILESSEPSEIKNVVSYERFLCEPKWKITRATEEQPVEEYYFFMDCPGEDAFGHCFFECFIFYPLLLEKIETHPSLKILTSNTKRYCKNFLNMIGVSSPIVHTVKPSGNIVFFPPIISMNSPDMNVVRTYTERYVNSIKALTAPPMRLLYLPRNMKENYSGNERTEPCMSDIVIRKGGSVLDTYLLNDMKAQMALVHSAVVLVVHWGSAFHVNCLTLQGKKIILLDSPVSVNQERALVMIKYIHNYIESRNTVFHIFSYDVELKDILDRLIV